MSNVTRSKGEEIIHRLYAGRLPKMVDWFDPLVLSMVAVRSMISTTIGDYADQRPMQEAADGEQDPAKLARRHDFGKIDPTNPRRVVAPESDNFAPTPNPNFDAGKPERHLHLDETGAMWVDFIADLGDGFEATYAMAYLLARPSIDVAGTKGAEGTHPLPNAQIVVFGGDLAYPNATMEEYRNRCLDPYDWSFTREPDKDPPRELFFIAGNHDWYDGLAAFTNQFCYESSAVGGWRIRQERSYFALRLPYNWWIWGVDIALGDNIDVGQRHYFRHVVEQMQPGDKVLIVLHAPDWLKQHYRGLSAICNIVRERGEICGILAGDLHVYARYKSEGRTPPLNLIISGGGGAFAHPTYDLKNNIGVEVAVARVASHAGAASTSAPSSDPKEEAAVQFRADGPFYPSRFKSRLLALKNLWLPLHNRRFALLVGVVYMIYAWVFQIAVSDPTVAIKNAQYVSIEMQCRAENSGAPAKIDACTAANKADFDRRLSSLTSVKDERAPPSGPTAQPGVSAGASRTGEARLQIDSAWQRFSTGVETEGGWPRYFWDVMSVQFSPNRVLSGMLASPAFFFLVAGLWIGLVQYVDAARLPAFFQWPVKLVLGTAHAGAHLTMLLMTHSVLDTVYGFFAASDNFIIKVAGISIYTLLMVVVGGIFGALIFGIYWVLTSVILSMHTDSFSALGIRHYKNFLRMKFEPDKLTIYPIAVDRIPGRTGWRVRRSDEDATHRPLIVPSHGLKARLIEAPIEIRKSAAGFSPPT